MFSWYMYLIVNLVFSHLGFSSGIFFLIALFSDRCLLVLGPPVPEKIFEAFTPYMAAILVM